MQHAVAVEKNVFILGWSYVPSKPPSAQLLSPSHQLPLGVSSHFQASWLLKLDYPCIALLYSQVSRRILVPDADMLALPEI